MIDQDVLMLTGMVNGSLNNIEKMMETKNSVGGPINKLNLQQIIHNKGSSSPVNLNNPAYFSEDVVKRMVPDVSLLSTPPVAENPVTVNIQQPPVIKTPEVVPEQKIELLEDIKTIKSTLLRIDANFTKISGMLGKVFNHITQKDKS